MMKTIMDLLRRFVGDRAGTAAVEFGLISSLMTPILLGMVDYGFALKTKMDLGGAARSGAQYTINMGYDPAYLANVVSASTGIPQESISVSASQYCECFDGSSVSGCSDTCSDGAAPHRFVSIDLAHDMTPMFIPWTIGINETQVVRMD